MRVKGIIKIFWIYDMTKFTQIMENEMNRGVAGSV
jgi:hypothetical protein